VGKKTDVLNDSFLMEIKIMTKKQGEKLQVDSKSIYLIYPASR